MTTFRLAQKEDVYAVANLHASNWKKHYRGFCPDQYLDEVVDKDRQKIWNERFESDNPLQHILVATDNQDIVIGFVCTFLDYHKEWGAYLDNLHVSSEHQGQGLGRQLMTHAAQWVKENRPTSKIYLHVLEKNIAAIGFYERLGGQRFGPLMETMPWGGKGKVYDFLWELEQLI